MTLVRIVAAALLAAAALHGGIAAAQSYPA